jgi:hypothetical protein
MTEQTRSPTGCAAVFTPDLPVEPASIQWGIDRLTIATEAMRLALNAADMDSRQGRHEEPTPAQAVNGWRASTLMLNAVFGRLSFEVANAIETMKLLLPPRRD